MGTRPTRTGLLRADEGFALPTVALLLVAAFAIVTVGVTATINTQHGTIRDQQTKAAVQLAETAVDQAVLSYNRLTPSLANPCSPVSSSPPDANRWCQGPTGLTLNGGNYRYQVQVPQMDQQGRFVAGSDGSITLRIVGTGWMGNATRRVVVDAKSLSNQPFNGEYQVRSAGDITLDGNAVIRAGTATNGGILLNNQSRVCGNVSVGIGRTVSGSGGYYDDSECTQQGTGYGQQDLNLDLLGAVPTTNEDARLFSQDPVSGNKRNACFDGHDGNVPPGASSSCGARELDVKQNTSVTLGGSVYVLCKLTMDQNTSLTLAISNGTEPKQVQIWFDSPENCGYPSGTAQLDMKSNSRITSNGGGKADVQLLFVGSQSTPFRQTIVSLASNTDQNAACEQNFIVYAPLSDVVIKGANSTQGSTYCGALAGRTVHVESNVELVSGRFDLSIQPPVPYYQATQFVECRAAAASAPNYDAEC